ncbi:hypothetical protein Pta02_47230 [Planobispora takensis]|uniref:Uncharacterized protein n=1 Tax=Planobispora takensis TaxID=1367882 RepID=A0A8J3T2A0_9ACTN|nr:hypothetical protein Pta02_47230 [Planobispora takensis]
MLGGAVAGAVTVVFSLVALLVIEAVAPGPDPAAGTGYVRDADPGADDGGAAGAVITGVAGLVQLGALGGVIGLVVGFVVALPVAPAIALAAPWLAPRPAWARLVCACAFAAAVAAFEALVILVSGGGESSPFGDSLIMGPPLVVAAIVGCRYGPALVAGAGPEEPR